MKKLMTSRIGARLCYGERISEATLRMEKKLFIIVAGLPNV
jgi:hypothetical protein